MIKRLLQTIVLSVGLTDCSYETLPPYFYTEVANIGSSSNENLLAHVTKAKTEIRELTGKDYNNVGLLDIDFDGIDDAYIVVGDHSLVYATLSSSSKNKYALENRLWTAIDPEVVSRAMQKFMDKLEEEESENPRLYEIIPFNDGKFKT